MIEWTRKTPKRGDRRITKAFCLWPKRCQKNHMVWLDFCYHFETYQENDYYTEKRGWWITEATLSPSQYRKFKEEIATHLTDPREEYRKYAEIVRDNLTKRRK